VSPSGGPGLSIAVVGATGALGRELLDVVADRNVPVRELRVYATDASVGEEVEFLGDYIPVEGAVDSLRGVDVAVLCTPPGASLELVRMALREEVSCIDCSGAVAASSEVPLFVSGISTPGSVMGAPLVATPGGFALAWSRVLRPLQQAAGLRHVVGTVLQSASSAGRAGIEELSQETIALLNQREPEAGERPGLVSAFDCVPFVGEAGEDASAAELRLRTELPRLLGEEVPMSVSCVQVPTFVGEGSALAVETLRPLSPAEAKEVFAKAPGLDLWLDGEPGPTTRDTTGRDEVLVGCIRGDSSVGNGLMLWAACDPLRAAAVNVVQLIETRLHLH